MLERSRFPEIFYSSMGGGMKKSFQRLLDEMKILGLPVPNCIDGNAHRGNYQVSAYAH
jgi:hypothetical protein